MKTLRLAFLSVFISSVLWFSGSVAADGCEDWNSHYDDYSGEYLTQCEEEFLREEPYNSNGVYNQIALTLEEEVGPAKGMAWFCNVVRSCAYEQTELEEGDSIFLNGKEVDEVSLLDRRSEDSNIYGFKFIEDALPGQNILHICEKRHYGEGLCVNGSVVRKAFSQGSGLNTIYVTPDSNISIEEGGKTRINFTLGNTGGEMNSSVLYWVGPVKQKTYRSVGGGNQGQGLVVNKSKYYLEGVFTENVKGNSNVLFSRFDEPDHHVVEFRTPSAWEEGDRIGVFTDSSRDGSEELVEEITAVGTVDESSLSVNRDPSEAPSGFVVDLNDDGIVNAEDTEILFNKIYESEISAEDSEYDYNCDTEATVSDAEVLREWIKGDFQLEECSGSPAQGIQIEPNGWEIVNFQETVEKSKFEACNGNQPAKAYSTYEETGYLKRISLDTEGELSSGTYFISSNSQSPCSLSDVELGKVPDKTVLNMQENTWNFIRLEEQISKSRFSSCNSEEEASVAYKGGEQYGYLQRHSLTGEGELGPGTYFVQIESGCQLDLSP
jgi:hypothetical protein